MGKHGVNKSTTAPTAAAPSNPKPAPAAALTPGPDGVIRANGYIWTGTTWILDPAVSQHILATAALNEAKQHKKVNAHNRSIQLVVVLLIIGAIGWAIANQQQKERDAVHQIVCDATGLPETSGGPCP